MGPFPSQRIIYYTKWRKLAEYLQAFFLPLCFLAVDAVRGGPSHTCYHSFPHRWAVSLSSVTSFYQVFDHRSEKSNPERDLWRPCATHRANVKGVCSSAAPHMAEDVTFKEWISAQHILCQPFYLGLSVLHGVVFPDFFINILMKNTERAFLHIFLSCAYHIRGRIHSNILLSFCFCLFFC